eukprot:345775_1
MANLLPLYPRRQLIMGSNGVFITTSQWNQFVYNYQMQECKLINLRGQYTILNQQLQLEDQKQKHQELQRHLVCMESKRSTSRADTTNSTSKSRTKWRIQHRILSIVNELLYGQYDLNKTETLALFDTILKERFNVKYPLEECLSSVHSVKEALLWMGTSMMSTPWQTKHYYICYYRIHANVAVK